MQATVPHRVLDHFVLILVMAAIALPITYIQIAHPSLEQIFSIVNVKAATPASEAAKPVVAVATHKTAPASSTPSPSQAKTAPSKVATTISFVHMRSGKSVASPIVTNLEAGTSVQLRDDADASWQGVTYQGKTGYIYRAYIQY